MQDLTHFNAKGEAHMVDVGDKAVTRRMARARGQIRMQAETLARISEGKTKKGDVLAIAQLAGIMGAKRTADLVPLCHPLPLSHVSVDWQILPELPGVACEVCAITDGKTGVEMEALCAVQVALLTVYDMCKAIDRAMIIEQVGLLEKVGGKSGHWQAPSS